jgi:hypothetical protein
MDVSFAGVGTGWSNGIVLFSMRSRARKRQRKRLRETEMTKKRESKTTEYMTE